MIALREYIAVKLEEGLAAMQDKYVVQLLKNDVYTISGCIRSGRDTYFPRYGVGSILYGELKQLLDAAGVQIVAGNPGEGHKIILAKDESPEMRLEAMAYVEEYFGLAM